MDQRGRIAQKRYRSSCESKYRTVSLTLSENIIDFIQDKVNESDGNFSSFIEKSMDGYPITEHPIKRKFGSYPIKKTFTFSGNFVDTLKKSGNMSLCVENALIDLFDIE